MNAALDISGETFVDKRGHKPRERRCVATGELRDPSEMIRFVRSPDNVVTVDITGKLPGRGVWVTADRASLETAIAKKAFARGFKSQVKTPDDLMAQVEMGLRRQVLGLLGMAKKSGLMVLGFDQVQSAARAKPLGWRIEAKDGSEDGRGKIRAIAKGIAHELEIAPPRVLGCFTAEELGQTMGRERIVHGALPTGKLSKSLNEQSSRLSGFCDLIPAEWPDIKHEATKHEKMPQKASNETS